MQFHQPQPETHSPQTSRFGEGEIHLLVPGEHLEGKQGRHIVEDFLGAFLSREDSEPGIDLELYQTCGYLEEYFENLTESGERKAFSRAVEEQLVQLLNNERFYFAAIIVNELLPGFQIRAQSELYKSAVGYALDGVVRYGDLDNFCAKVAYLSDSYLELPQAHQSIEARLQDIFENKSPTELYQLQRIVDEVERVDEPGIRTELVRQYRARAEESFLSDPISPWGTALRDFFWLEEWLESSQAQSAIGEKMGECLSNGLLLEAAEFVLILPVSLETIRSFRQTAQMAVATEKAKIAAGYYDSLPPQELSMMIIEPLNSIVSLFGLTENLREEIPLPSN
ncbi:MAG: hypothetical protein KDD64_00870 [Bdellovibrionales bacterium]|nr:hypothetical protein [Bdellovibrionales bacterium]